MRAQHRDHEAFAELFRLHAPSVLRFVQRRSGSASFADDVTAATFENAWRSLSTFSGDDDRFRPWVMRIAANEMASIHRSEARRAKREDRTTRADLAVRPSGDPQEQGADLGGLAPAQLRAALSHLTSTHQEIIMFRFFADMSSADIAAALDIAPGTASVRLHRALHALRDVLKPVAETGGADD